MEWLLEDRLEYKKQCDHCIKTERLCNREEKLMRHILFQEIYFVNTE